MAFPFIKSLTSLIDAVSPKGKPFKPRSPKIMTAIYLSEDQQEDLGGQFHMLLPTAEQVGLFNMSTERFNDYLPKVKELANTVKWSIWGVSFVSASAINIRIFQAVVPEQLEQVGLAYPVMLVVSGVLVLLVDHIIDTELSAVLLCKEAERIKNRLKLDSIGLLTCAYHLGRQEAFDRVQAAFIGKRSWLRRGKLGLLGIIALAEFGAAINNAMMTNEFERFGIFAIFAPMVGVMLTGMSGLFKASVIDYPHHKKAVAQSYYDITKETDNDGQLDDKLRFAELVTEEFKKNPDLTQEDLNRLHQQQQTAEIIAQYDTELMEVMRVYQERLAALNDTYHQKMEDLAKKEVQHLSSAKKSSEIQLKKNLAKRRHCTSCLALIREKLSDLFLLQSKYKVVNVSYDTQKASLEQQAQLCEEQLRDLNSLQKNLKRQNTDKILPFPHKEEEDKIA